MFNMFKSKVSLPNRKPNTSIKRLSDEKDTYSKPHKLPKTNHVDKHQQQVEAEPDSPEISDEPRFTFEEVKTMIEKLLEKQGKTSAVCAGLKRVNFEEIAIEGHSVEGCKELVEKLVQNTRRIRTLQEVLTDIKENLNKRTYTEIIHRATIKGEKPKRPPSAYLLYHQDRYNELKDENTLAVEVSKIVAEEWKTLSDKKRREYQKRHAELLQAYENEMERLGLHDGEAPKRPKSARALFIEDSLEGKNYSKEKLAKKRDELGQEFDSLDAEKKHKWLQLHKENQERYKKEREEYIAAHPHLHHNDPKDRVRTSSKPKLPEPPKSALKFFMQKKMNEELEGKELEEEKKRLRDKFANLRQKKLLKYIKKAVQDKERYDHEVEAFKAEHPTIAIPKLKPSISKDQWKLYAKVVENRPTMPAPTAYLYYCGKMLTDMNENDNEQMPTARMQSASMAWRQCSEKMRKKAIEEHMKDIERYITEMEAWLATKPEEQRLQILSEEPKVNPDYWKRKLTRIKKAEKSGSQQSEKNSPQKDKDEAKKSAKVDLTKSEKGDPKDWKKNGLKKSK